MDDRSAVPYQEYRWVYGEDAESALRFLFNAMAAKGFPEYPFQRRPLMIYLDNGPVAKSRVAPLQLQLFLAENRVKMLVGPVSNAGHYMYVLLPLSLLFSVFLMGQGVIQNFSPYQEVALVEPARYSQVLAGTALAGPQAGWRPGTALAGRPVSGEIQ